MTEPGRHPGDALQRLLDERLPPPQRAAVQAHLLRCGQCRRELDALRGVKAVVHEGLPEHPVPPEVAARISAALATQPSRGTRRLAAVAGLSLAAAAVLAIVLTRSFRPDIVADAVTAFTTAGAPGVALQIETSDPRAVERLFADRGLPFSPRIFDFGMMGYRLNGGGVHRIGNRVSALLAYIGPDGKRVVCQMFRGTASELPPPAEEREHGGIRFRIYRSAGLTLVFWQEGPIMCVLVADGDPEAAIQLAYAKAVIV